MKKYLRSLMFDVLLALVLLWGWYRRKAQPLILWPHGRYSAVLSALRRAWPVWSPMSTGCEIRAKVFPSIPS